MDDSCLHHTVPFSENVDYLSNNSISNYHLYLCWKQNNSISIKAHKEDISVTIPLTISRRLENTSWRRWVKQQKVLSEVLPAIINWNKYQDVTWLYGPKYTSSCPYESNGDSESKRFSQDTDMNKNICVQNVHNRSADSLDSSSAKAAEIRDASFTELTHSNLRKWSEAPEADSDDLVSFGLTSSMSFKSELMDEDSDDENDMSYSHLKPVLKQRSSPFAQNSRHKKQVKFNYVINSREYSNGLLFDYYFLDALCLY